jgi:hypothetical protein
MKKCMILILVLAAASLAAPLAAKDRKPFESRWTPVPIQIDGQQTEWPAETLAINENFGVNYNFMNDGNFLYCVFVFNDPRYLSSIEASGLTFWINPQKEKRTHGFRFYRKMVSADQLIQEMEKKGTGLTDQQKNEIKAKPRYTLYSCDVLDKKGNIIPHLPGTANGTYRVARVQKTMVFEYVIPLALLVDPQQQPALDSSQPFKLGFEWGGMTEEMKKQSTAEIGDQNVKVGSGETSMTVSGGIGERAEGVESGGNSVSLENIRRGPKKYNFWIDLKLGEKK